jgi:large subunit ribosomal protein L30
VIEGQETSLKWAAPLIERKVKAEAEAKDEKEQSAVDVGPPHMLHVIYRIKTTHGRPWWEKDIVKKLMLDGKMHQPVIHKNVPYVNKLLNEIKHLVRILPLTFPNGLPYNEADWEHSQINSRGEMVIIRRLQQFEPQLGTLPDADKEKWKLDLDTVKKDCEKTVRDYKVHMQYHLASYVYRRNQDGKEYRYNFNKNVPKYYW